MSMSCCAAPTGALPTTSSAPPAPGGGPSSDVAGASGGGLAAGASSQMAAAIQTLADAVTQLSTLVTAMGGGAQAAAGAAAIGSAPTSQGANAAPDASTASVLAGQTSGGGAPGTQPATKEKPGSGEGAKAGAKAKPDAPDTPPGGAANGGKSLRPLGQLTPDQFSAKRGGDAACGPVAAVAISRFLGKDLDIDTAVNEAAKVGWTAQQGMAGPASEQKLLSNLGIKSHLEEGVDWEKVKKTVMAGTPVIIDTPTHYWVAERFDPKTGRFDFGKSGSVFKNEDRTWYTPEEMKAHGAAARAAIFIDS